jgi:hypothetical protein
LSPYIVRRCSWQLIVQLIVAVALALNAANLIGYTKCDKNARQKISNMAGRIGQSLLQQALGTVAAGLTGAPSAP